MQCCNAYSFQLLSLLQISTFENIILGESMDAVNPGAFLKYSFIRNSTNPDGQIGLAYLAVNAG